MTRIQHILGLETERPRSGGLWTALTMAVVFSASVSAIAIGGGAEESKATQDSSLELVDIVRVVAGHDREQAKLLAKLRERGLDTTKVGGSTSFCPACCRSRRRPAAKSRQSGKWVSSVKWVFSPVSPEPRRLSPSASRLLCASARRSSFP